MRTLLLLLPLAACTPETSTEDKDATSGGDPVDADQDGVTGDDGDCDDGDAGVYPGADEICDGRDNDCDDEVDEGVMTTFYTDADGDGFGDPNAGFEACESDGVTNPEDCDDSDPAVSPSGVEVCDEIDNDCDGDIDEEVQNLYYADADGDGFGNAAAPVLACAQQSGTVEDASDCDDSDVDSNPAASEVCDEVDNDCDGTVDDGVLTTYYVDLDDDGWGETSLTQEACATPTGYAADSGDCDDTDANYHPGADESDCSDPNDYNCDGSVSYADADKDGWAACEECDDGVAEVNPAATERCNEVDDDCDGDTDEPDAADASTWYLDYDRDGYGGETLTEVACDAPALYVGNDDDCDDTEADVSPSGVEVCNEVDDDCDGEVDEDASDRATWYEDKDGDGHGGDDVSELGCDAPEGFVAEADDCDDADDAVHPDATETCNDIDDDCDGTVDGSGASGAEDWFADVDEDGFGDVMDSTTDCEQPAGYTAESGDCDDADEAINPDADEVCDGVDNDCDGTTDGAGAIDLATWYGDGDGDGYGDSSDSVSDCDQPEGYVADGGDCDDADDTRSPGAREDCDGVDDDCDGEIDVGEGAWSDDFDDDDISDWSILDGAWAVSGGIVTGYSSSHTGPDLVHSTGIPDDVDTYTVHVYGAGNHSFGTILAYASDGSHCGFFLWANSTLYKVNPSTIETSVASVSYSTGTYYELTGEVSPGNVDLYLDSSLIFSGDAGCGSVSRTDQMGFQVHQSVTASYDSICVEW